MSMRRCRGSLPGHLTVRIAVGVAVLAHWSPKVSTGMGGNFRDLLVQNVGNGWVAGGCWDDDITSDDWDHSRKFPAFSTSKHSTMYEFQDGDVI